MKSVIFLTLAVAVCGMFDITYPEGINLNFTAQQFECVYDPDAKVYPWNPRGSPLGLKLYIDRTLIEVYYCRGDDWQDYADWSRCRRLQRFVQPLAGDVCIQNVTDVDERVEYEEIGTNGTIRIYYEENGDGSSLQCIPITISNEGPEWDGDNCETDENTGFQPFDHMYFELYGPSYLDVFADEDLDDSVSMEYVTYTVKDGKTSAEYNYWLISSGGSTLVDLKTLTPKSVTWAGPDYFITFTSDGTKILYNGAQTVYGWTSTETDINLDSSTVTFTRASSQRSSSSGSGSATLTGRTTSRRLSSAETGGDTETASETGSATGSATVTAASNTADSSSTSEASSSSTSSSATDLGSVLSVSGIMVYAAIALGPLW